MPLIYCLQPFNTYHSSYERGGEDIQGVQGKLCFFTIHCKPSLAYTAVRDLQSSQRNARERWQTFEISWKKTQYLMNTLYNNIGYNKRSWNLCSNNTASIRSRPDLAGQKHNRLRLLIFKKKGSGSEYFSKNSSGSSLIIW